MSNVVSISDYRNIDNKQSSADEGMALLRDRAEIERMEAASDEKGMALIRWKMRFLEYADRHGL